MNHFLRHPFFRKLLALQLPESDYAVAGSGPLYARRFIEEIGDVDIAPSREGLRDTERTLTTVETLVEKIAADLLAKLQAITPTAAPQLRVQSGG